MEETRKEMKRSELGTGVAPAQGLIKHGCRSLKLGMKNCSFFSLCFMVLSFASPSHGSDSIPAPSVLDSAAFEAVNRFGAGSSAEFVTSFYDLEGNPSTHLFLVTKVQQSATEDVDGSEDLQEEFSATMLIQERQGECFLIAFHRGTPIYLMAERDAETSALAYSKRKPVKRVGVLYVSPLEYYFEFEVGDESILVNAFDLKILSRDDLGKSTVPAPFIAPHEETGEYPNTQRAVARYPAGTSEAALYPSSLIIGEVPDYNQRSSMLNSCGPTAGATLLGFWDAQGYAVFLEGEKTYDDVTRLIEELSMAMDWGPLSGVYYYMVPIGLRNVINSRGQEFGIGSLYAIESIDIVKREINEDRPFIYGSQVNVWSGGHIVVVLGYDGNFIVVHDNFQDTPIDYYVNWHALGHADDMLVTIYPQGQGAVPVTSEALPSYSGGGGGGCFISAAAQH
jgi:hypothetical protein